ncbi:MAG: response regulator, partial [Myxococcales bacterium]|nr:response regulator [Myxococcales bacterium]
NGWLLVEGTMSLVGRRCPAVFHVTFAAVASWSVIAVLREEPFFWRVAPAFLTLGGSMIAAGVALARSGEGGRLARLAGGVLIAWGIHRLDYPFLRPITWAAPIGFSLATLLEQLTAVSFVLLHVERGRRRLRGSEERYRGLVEDSPVGIFRASRCGELLDASPVLVRLLGFADGTPLAEIATSPAWLPLVEELKELGPEGAEVELAIGGRMRRLALQGRRLEENAGWQGIVQDVTEAHRMAERLQASERLEALGRLAGGVAHDFNNVLNVIQTGVAAARDPRIPEGARTQVLADVGDAVDRGARVTRQLLTLSRFRGVRERFDLGLEVSGSARFLTQIVGDDVSLDLVVQPVDVEMERVHVQQILMNLVANARDAMPQGGRIAVEVARVDDADVGADEPSLPWAVLRVRDAGVGMDSATQERAFEAFFSTKGKRGTGLGLVTVRAAAVTSGGAVRVSSKPGEGTTIEVIFPLASGDEVARGPAVERRLSRVLLVDDEAAVRRGLAEPLRRAGLEVVEASDGAEALDTFAPDDFDVLVSDVHMPELDGVALAEAVRRRAPEFPVLFVSGFSETSVDEILDRVPGARFATKPISAEGVLAELDVLGRR